MNKEKLTFQAAQYAFGTFNTQEMQQLVNDLIDEGIFEDVFLDVIWPEMDTRERVGEAFERAMQCIGIDIPDYEKAVWNILHYHILRIAKEEVDPIDGVAMLWNDVDSNYFFQRSEKWFGDSHDVGYFYGIYSDYQDELGKSVVVSYDKEKGR